MLMRIREPVAIKYFFIKALIWGFVGRLIRTISSQAIISTSNNIVKKLKGAGLVTQFQTFMCKLSILKCVKNILKTALENISLWDACSHKVTNMYINKK